MRRREFIMLAGGAAAAWPVAARAQQPAMPVIGFVSLLASDTDAGRTAAFRAGLAETGFVEGRNVAIEFRWADGHFERLPTMFNELVRRPVSVIFTAGGDVTALIAKGATTTIPIVFQTGGDPVAAGLVTSFNHPGGNVTGMTTISGQLGIKLFELLREFVPTATAIGMVVNPNNPYSKRSATDVEKAARTVGQQVHVMQVSNEPEIETAFLTLATLKVGGLLVTSDPIFLTQSNKFVALAARYALPAVYYVREFVAAGGLMSYGTSFPAVYHQAGEYVGRILKGEKPGDLPIQQPTKFELVINLKTAKALGLNVPPTLLARADEVIE
jgi:putative tryptophan/tyrosine transport system substrate-binding protein